MRVPVDRFLAGMVDWQVKLFRAFDSKIARFYDCECHRRARKTTGAINLLIRECLRTYNSSYFYMGPTYAQAKDIIWLDPNMLFAYLPSQSEYPWEKNESDLYIRFPLNNTILHILGGDKPDRLRGIDAKGGVLDEWALMKEEIFTQILMPIMTPDPTRWLLFLYTPKGQNHATRMFDKGGKIASDKDLPVNGPTKDRLPDWYCIRLDAEHSGIIPQNELAKAKKEMPAHLYDQEMRCARVTAEERSLITSLLLSNLEGVYVISTALKKIIACDPSEGGDEIVIRYFENTAEPDPPIILHKAGIADNLMILSGHLKNLSMAKKCNNFILDGIGIGKGVADDLRLNENYNVQVFKGNEEANDSEQFADKNMEATWYVSRQMRLGKVEPIEDDETKRQLVVASRFQPNHKGQLALDRSDLIRKDLGCSPDRAKAYIMGIYGLQNVSAEITESVEPKRTRARRGLMAASPMGL